jgi:hypothetical protein
MEHAAGLSKTALPTGPFDLMSPEAMGDFELKAPADLYVVQARILTHREIIPRETRLRG